MKTKVIRLTIGVFAGMAILAAVIWLLGKTLGNTHYPTLYAGNTIEYWNRQLYGHDAGASNAASAILNSQVIPQLVDAMVHDTNDSSARLWVIKTLNGLPGVDIQYEPADERRADAAGCLGDLGPAAKSALPDIIKALKGTDAAIRKAAISSLGKIRSEPETVIPLLITYLDDNALDAPAADALAEFGSLAKSAVPKLLPLLLAGDDDDQAAAQEALLKIDPDAAAKAGVKRE
jgi:HEAT repeat protein